MGWKYFSDHEHPNSQYAIELPSYLVDTLREIAGHDRVVNSTDLLMHPGLRAPHLLHSLGNCVF